jgi:hypothetical protein
MPSVQIVVTCSDRKRGLVPARLRLGSLPRQADRAGRWIERLETEAARPIAGIDLYAGEHWSAVKDLLTVASTQGFSADLWICSAGYGLVPASAQLKPYAATFARGHADSVDQPGDSHDVTASWWINLSRWRGPLNGAARSLTELAQQRPRTPMLIVASPPYLRAMADDVAEAGALLGSRLLVISTGARPGHRLQEFLVPVDARFQHRVGGSRIGLNARVAAMLLERCGGHLDRDAVAKTMRAAARTLPELPRYERTSLTDKEATQYIRKTLRESPGISATTALKQLRQAGWACEQKRFGQLFRAVEGAQVGA